MPAKIALALLASLLLLAGCASVGAQTRVQPDLSVRLSDPALTRIYVFNGLGQVIKKTEVHVEEGGIPVGDITRHRYLVWERNPGTHLLRAQAQFKVEGTYGAHAEALLSLTAAPGDVQYVLLDVQIAGEKLQARQLSEEEGLALIDEYEVAEYDR